MPQDWVLDEDKWNKAKKQAEKQPRQYPGDEKFAYGLFSQYTVDDQDGARWDKNAQRAGGSHRTRGHCVIVTILLHLRERYLAHCRRRSRRRTAYGGRTGAGKYGSHG